MFCLATPSNTLVLPLPANPPSLCRSIALTFSIISSSCHKLFSHAAFVAKYRSPYVLALTPTPSQVVYLPQKLPLFAHMYIRTRMRWLHLHKSKAREQVRPRQLTDSSIYASSSPQTSLSPSPSPSPSAPTAKVVGIEGGWLPGGNRAIKTKIADCTGSSVVFRPIELTIKCT